MFINVIAVFAALVFMMALCFDRTNLSQLSKQELDLLHSRLSLFKVFYEMVVAVVVNLILIIK